MSDNDDAASYEWPTIRPERLLHTVAFMGVIGARPGRKQAFRLPSPALIALFPVDIGDSDWFVESSCGPNRWKHRAPRRHRLSLCYRLGHNHVYYVIQLEVHAQSRCLACGEIAKGIDDDAQSTGVRSIGRGDGSLAGVGRIGSSVNHRLA